MDARQVKDALNSRAAEVCLYLIPGGKVRGSEFVAGDIRGSDGASFHVSLSGAKQGVWADFAVQGCSGSNLIDLWMQARGVPFVEALKEAKSWLGIPDLPDRPTMNTQRRTAVEALGDSGKKAAAAPGKMELTYHRAEKGGKVWSWLAGRGIKDEAIVAYRIGEESFEMAEKYRTFVIFPFYDANGNLVRLKYRDIDDKKVMWQKPKAADALQYKHGIQKLLFGWQAIGPEDQQVAITEGEIDAMTIFGEGVKALSLPEGAQPKKASENEIGESHKQWIEHDYDALERFTDILISTDMDEPGRAAAAAIAPRLGIHRIRMVEFAKAKDANEALQTGELEFALVTAEEMRPPELKRPSEFREAIWNEFFPTKERSGFELPWNMRFAFRKGQLTIWQGYNSSGKTICMTFTMTHLAYKYEKRICIASMEMSAAKSFKNAMRQAIGHGKPWGNDADREAVFSAGLRWLDDRFLVFDRLGEVDVRDVLAVFEYAYRRYGAEHFVLDSLMMLRGQGEEESKLYANQRDVVKMLKDFAVKFDVHVHLVAHSKKPDSKKDPRKSWPSKFDISGSANLSNIADNVVCIWRHEYKEECIRSAGESLRLRQIQRDPVEKDKCEKEIKKWKDREDAMFIVQKQRETGEMPSKRLYFDYGDEGSWQYLEEPDKRHYVKCFVPELEEGWAAAHRARKWHVDSDSPQKTQSDFAFDSELDSAAEEDGEEAD